MHSLRFLCPALAALMATASGRQNPIPSELTIRTTTTLVQVGVSVLDAKGRPVQGLKKEDFQVLDNGKRQTISVFYEEAAAATPAGESEDGSSSAVTSPAATLPATTSTKPTLGAFTNRLMDKLPGHATYSIILVDWSNSAFENAAAGRDEARKALERIPASERVGLYSLDNSAMRVINEVGASRTAILKSLKSLTGLTSPCYQPRLNSLDRKGDDSLINCAGGNPDNPTTAERELLAFQIRKRGRTTMAAFEAISTHLAGLPGRKSVIWISAGFPKQIVLGNPRLSGARGSVTSLDSEIAAAIRKLNNADVAVYPVDARGLTLKNPTLDANNNTWGTMDEMAARTGGKAFHGSNDLQTGIVEAVQDAEGGYTLGFYPQGSGRPGLHKLTVHALRPGLKLRYKEGYDAIEPPKATEGAGKETVVEALMALMDSTAIPIDIKATRQKDSVRLLITLQPDTLGLTPQDHHWQGAVAVITRFAKEDGSEAAPPGMRKLPLNLSESTYHPAEGRGLEFSTTLEIPANAVRLRVLIRSETSGQIGTVTIPISEIVGALSTFAPPADWPQFRGPHSSGIGDGKPPVEFGPNQNMLWRATVGAGLSSPIVSKGRIFVTEFNPGTKQLATVCLEQRNGKVLWRRTVAPAEIEQVHSISSPAAPTPSTDGERVYVYFGSYGLLAYDLDGKLLWERRFPIPENIYGAVASPIVAGGYVILNHQGKDAYLLAVDRRDGKTVWKTDRSKYQFGWSTPVYWRHDGIDEVLVLGGDFGPNQRLMAYNLADGAERWWVAGLPPCGKSTPVIGGDGMVFFAAPDIIMDSQAEQANPERAARMYANNNSRVMAVRAGGQGEVNQTNVVWSEHKGTPGVPSPLYYNGRIYTVQNGGIVYARKAATGELVYSGRTGAAGYYYASPVAADNKIYLASEEGMVVVLDGGDELKVLAKNNLDGQILATPAIVDGKIYVRAAGYLYAFGR